MISNDIILFSKLAYVFSLEGFFFFSYKFPTRQYPIYVVSIYHDFPLDFK
jgi:hypothetical protein